jgi:hypothetical protein
MTKFRNIVILTGAGLSAESGLGTFPHQASRSPLQVCSELAGPRAHLDSHVEALAGLRDGDARFALPVKQRHQCQP